MKRKNRLRRVQVLSFLVFALCSGLIYYFSPDSRILSLSCTGNYYYSRQQVYRLANVSADSRYFLSPEFSIRDSLMKDPLIEDVSVDYQHSGIHIQVEERTVLGYFEAEGNQYFLMLDGSVVPAADIAYPSSISGIPVLAGFTRRQMESIAGEFSRYSQYITRDIIAKIAEMVPWEESFDDQMIKMTMQDGNVVISSLNDLLMISKYQLLLEKLQGDHVCLFLDRSNSAIDKISCSYIYMTAEERDQYRKELREELERIRREAEEEAKRLEEEARQREEEAAREAEEAEDQGEDEIFEETEQDIQEAAEDFQEYPEEEYTGDEYGEEQYSEDGEYLETWQEEQAGE